MGIKACNQAVYSHISYKSLFLFDSYLAFKQGV
jgi:hypothetical protein